MQCIYSKGRSLQPTAVGSFTSHVIRYYNMSAFLVICIGSRTSRQPKFWLFYRLLWRLVVHLRVRSFLHRDQRWCCEPELICLCYREVRYADSCRCTSIL